MIFRHAMALAGPGARVIRRAGPCRALHRSEIYDFDLLLNKKLNAAAAAGKAGAQSMAATAHRQPTLKSVEQAEVQLGDISPCQRASLHRGDGGGPQSRRRQRPRRMRQGAEGRRGHAQPLTRDAFRRAMGPGLIEGRFSKAYFAAREGISRSLVPQFRSARRISGAKRRPCARAAVRAAAFARFQPIVTAARAPLALRSRRRAPQGPALRRISPIAIDRRDLGTALARAFCAEICRARPVAPGAIWF